VGKWHLGQLPAFGPLKSGYDHFYGFRGGAVDYYAHGSGGHDDLWDDDVQVHQMGYMTDLLGSRAVDVVNGYAKSRRPFLLSLHFNAPHWPWEAPGDEAESKRIGTKDLHDFDGGTQKTYQRMIVAMDVQIGRVVAALDANGLTENTVVIFTSDNGGERFADTWPFTGRKQELLEVRPRQLATGNDSRGCTDRAHAILALQGKCAAGHARRQLQVSEDP
jgi:arylsulfatase A-like enzyme